MARKSNGTPLQFRWRRNAHHPADADPQHVHQWLEEVQKQYGEATKVTVTDAAEADPEHEVAAPWFTWDGELATRKCHEYEAQDMIRSVVVLNVAPTQKYAVPAWVSVVDDTGHHRYEPVTTVLLRSDSDQINRLVNEAQQQINGLVTRLNGLVELIGMLGRAKAES